MIDWIVWHSWYSNSVEKKSNFTNLEREGDGNDQFYLNKKLYLDMNAAVKWTNSY